MARSAGPAGVRNIPVATRLSRVETAGLDRQRGALSRAEYLRWLVLQDLKAR